MKLSLALLGGLLVASSSAFQVPSRPSFSSVARSSSACAPLSMVAVNIDEGTNRELGAMDEWATACGVQRCGGFQFTSEDGSDWSIMTTEPLDQGTPILYVPSEMILSAARVRQELNAEAAVDQLTKKGAGDQVAQFYLFLKVLVEYEKGDQSPWFPWLNSLPRLYYNAVSMTDFCLECLPPLVFALARTERVKFDNFYDTLQKVDFLSAQTKENKDLARWAFNVVSTRSVDLNGDKQIAPMADMFNHGTETEVVLQSDENGNCVAYASKEVPAGSPLRMSYGDPTNPSHLFATYGFLDETSPATFCKIMTITPTPQLRDMGFDFSRMLFYKDTGDISEEVYDVMLYQILGKANREAQQAFYEAHMAGDSATKQQFHQHYFAETGMALKEHVDTFLKQLDELSAKGVGKDLNEHPRLPLIMKHNDFVKTTFLRVKERLDPMVAQAAGEPALM